MVPRTELTVAYGWRKVIGACLIAAVFGLQPGIARAENGSSGSFFSAGLQALFGGAAAPAKAAKRTRVIIEVTRRSKFEVFSLSSPNRVIIELPKVGMRLPQVGRGRKSGLVKRLRAGNSAPGKSRIVLNVSEPVVVENARMVASADGKGAELIMDIVPLSAAVAKPRKASFGKAFSLGGPAVQPPVPRQARGQRDREPASSFKPLIVVDPGHGGRDSGASKFGVKEKNVVLAFGLELRNKLKATGRYRVLMTRSTDKFITLDNRRRLAERHNAALFIAVHADYASTNARGATIYSLRKRVANRLRRTAAAEAARSVLSKPEMKFASASDSDIRSVRGILGDLAQREVQVNLERTNVFTKFAIDQMGAATTMRSKPHREAAFKVLKTAKVPSVLIELAYVSNRRDAARLQSQRWRKEVSGSLVQAIDRYFAHSLSQIPQ